MYIYTTLNNVDVQIKYNDYFIGIEWHREDMWENNYRENHSQFVEIELFNWNLVKIVEHCMLPLIQLTENGRHGAVVSFM